jgi:hypothetical protein
MTLKGLDILKKGFSKFTKTIKARRDELNTKLARKETILSVDERWLDHEAKTSDKEIYRAVMDSIKARENIDINGGDDVDDDSPMEPCPTRREVLKALSTIGKCIEDSNDPIARKLDILLGTSNRQLHLKET